MGRLLAMTEEELRAHIAARGLDWDTEVTKLKSFREDRPMEELEKALFGASLDDIMKLSEFTDLELRLAGDLRNNQDAHSEPVGPARPRRDHTTAARSDEVTQARKPSVAIRPSQKSN
jgi:hypothetical protein